MKRFLLIVLAVSLLCACAPKQPKTMEQQAEEARAEASRNNGGTEDKQSDKEKRDVERETSLGDILTIISY